MANNNDSNSNTGSPPTAGFDQIPMIGMGTAGLQPYIIPTLIDAALVCGYRLFDTAPLYGNDAAVGAALKNLLPKHHLKREDIFLTSKLLPEKLGTDEVRNEILKTLEALQTDYLDLYLIHSPRRCAQDNKNPEISRYRLKTWQQFEALKESGLVKHIGVSNFIQRHLEEIITNSSSKPFVNQIEFHPHLQRQGLVKFCRDQGIIVQGHSPFAAGEKSLLGETILESMAERNSCSVHQLILAWIMSQGVSTIPRPDAVSHVNANFEANNLKLSDDDIAAISALNRNQGYAISCDTWNTI